VNDPTGTYAFAYDNMGRLIGTTTSYSFLTSRNFTNAYNYDAASNRTGFTNLTSYFEIWKRYSLHGKGIQGAEQRIR
jgi:YD repeat-containing protein